MAQSKSQYEEYLLLDGRAKESRSTLDPSFGNKYHYPSGRKQKNRLDNRFKALESQFQLSKRGARLSVGVEGNLPDQVVVLEVVGDISDFIAAAKKIEGLELQFEFSSDEIPSSEDFYIPKKKKEEIENKTQSVHTITTKMFLILSDQEAMRKILVLWNKWKRAPKKSFERGLGKWKDLFQRLYDVRLWSDNDRLDETGVIEYWSQQIGLNKELIYSEIELWFTSDPVKRRNFELSLRTVVEAMGGQIVSSTIIPEIRYHALIAKIPQGEVGNFIKGNLGGLAGKSSIMFFRPCSQALVIANDKPEYTGAVSITTQVPNKGEKCLVLDGFPLENHNYLKNWINVNDLFDFSSRCPPGDRKHGTAVSSLIIHGENLLNSRPVPYKIVVTPILKPEVVNLSGTKAELLPEDLNILDLVHRAVVNNLEQYPEIKIVNFSIGITGRPFNQIISPLARLIDWLSWKYKIVFIISAGNCVDNVGVDLANWSAMTPVQKKDHVVTKIFKDIRNRKILSPAESFNGLTVGALHSDKYPSQIQSSLIDPAHADYISPITRFGPGIKRAIKPEIYFPGGTQLIHNVLPGQNFLKITQYNAAPGIMTAAPISTGGLSGTSFQRGTSFSAALASHQGLQILDFLDKQRAAGKVIPNEYDHLLIKALLVNSADTVDFIKKTKEFLTSFGLSSYAIAEMSFAISGYGKAQPERNFGCSDYRVTAIAFGSILHEKSMEYTFPIPDNLGGKRGLRRVTTTLAWASAINSNSQKYRASALFSEISGMARIGCERDGVYEKSSRRGSVEHSVFEGESARSFSQNSNLTITVNCREDGMKIVTPIPYAFAVTMETNEADDIKIFQQIKTRIQTQVRAGVTPA